MKKRGKKKKNEALAAVHEQHAAHAGMSAAPPGIPSHICGHCKRIGHWKEICPVLAAKSRKQKMLRNMRWLSQIATPLGKPALHVGGTIVRILIIEMERAMLRM